MATIETNLCKVIKIEGHYYVIDVHTGVQYADKDDGKYLTIRRACDRNVLLARRLNQKDELVYELTEINVEEYENNIIKKGKDIINMTKVESNKIVVKFDMDKAADFQAFKTFLHGDCAKLKPDDLFLPNQTWKMLVRNCLKGKNIMITGPAGCGKTQSAFAVAKSLSRPMYYFNLGSTQDPRAVLIGNTHLNKEKGTYFEQSAFVQAIQEPNAVIILDEFSRGNLEAWNILMSVLDVKLRYLRIDEDIHSPAINVAPGVSFIGTANIGLEYTATRTIDRAASDRFMPVEVMPLEKSQELRLLKKKFPKANVDMLDSLCKISEANRKEYYSDSPKITVMLSTRHILECGECLEDGFSLIDVAKQCILPLFSNDGGPSSERAYMLKMIQKFVDGDNVNKKDSSNKPDVDEDHII